MTLPRSMKVDDVPFARFWIASSRDGERLRAIFIECERWVDARRVARTVMCSAEVYIGPVDLEGARQIPAPRVQVRWTGSAARRVSDLRIQIRLIDERGKPAADWSDLGR